MLASIPCPNLDDYRRLVSGDSAEAQAEELLCHLETCAVCAGKIQTLPASDTLIEWIQQAKTFTLSPQEKPLNPLIQHLIQLGKPTGRLTFSCTGCGKPLRVKAEAAGKKVKCPHCAQVMPAPERQGDAAQTSAVASVETVHQPPAPSDASEVEMPSSAPTLVAWAQSSKERELCSFFAPAQAPDELGRLGPYRVLKVLGAGGMGVVFRAENPNLQRVVALKAMLPALAVNESLRQRFVREARLAASLKHDHVVTIYHVGEDRGALFLAMEFLEGESLEDRLQREGKLSLAEVLRIGREIAEGLKAAHERGLIHRDIKPANVWLEGKRGRVKILDFGLARSAGDNVHLTHSGVIVGTPAYMPPEQGRGKNVDARCDLYSLGCVLYRLCTGELPFKADNTMSLLMALAIEQPKSPRDLNPDVSPPLADLILRLLAKEPAQRLATAAEVAQVLEDIAAEKTVVMAAARPPVPPRRRKLLWAATVGALLVAALLSVIVIRPGKPKEAPAALETVDPDEGVTRQANEKVAAARAHLPPPSQVPEPPPLAQWIKGRKVLTVAQDSSGQFKTIQAALNALKPGQVIKVLDRGPYPETLQLFAVPEDTALISEQGTVLELSKWERIAGHELCRVSGFRFSGFKLRAPAAKEWHALTYWGGHPRGLVIEDCCFRAPFTGSAINLDFNGSDTNPSSVWLRRCFLVGGLTLFGNDEGLSIVTIEQNYFQESVPWCEADQLKLLVIRHNVFASHGPQFKRIVKGPLSMEIYNNTILNGVPFRKAAPIQRVVLCNNFLRFGWQFEEGTEAFGADAIKNWSVDHNGYQEYFEHPRTLSLGPKEFTAAPTFLSQNSTSSDYLRPTTDSPLAKGGAGGAWPSYIGALPPGPAPKDGDWFTRLRQRWGKLATSGTLPQPPMPLDPAWVKSVAALPPKKQIEAVVAKLKERNPGFDGNVDYKIDDGEATELRLSGEAVVDISAVRALPELHALTCTNAPLADLSPLKGMKLKDLDFAHTQASDLSPLKGIPLRHLFCEETPVSDLSPLKGMKLTALKIALTPVSDLTPLKEMKLKYLTCEFTKIADLSPLKGMPLIYLTCQGTPVSDLSPLKGMPLRHLTCQWMKLTDLSPLKGMPLQNLYCDFKPQRDTALLRSIKTLEAINSKPAAEFWKEVDAKAATKKP